MTLKKSLPAKSSFRTLEKVDPLRRYLVEINKYPFLTSQEEHELAIKFRDSGDREAVRRLVTSHLRLVVKIALEYKTAYGNVLDLIQEGNLGLMKAIKKYDPEKGTRLSSYAMWWIRSYILKYILDNFRLIKVGTTQAQRRIFFNLMKEKERIEKAGFVPDSKNLARALNVKEEEVQEMEARLGKTDLYLDAPIGEDGEKRQIDFIKSETPDYDTTLDKAEFRDILEEKLKSFSTSLNERELKIFQDRLLSEMPITLQTIADQYGISRERARQIEVRIKEKLKEFFQKEGLRVEEHLAS